jgi:hypothetical protein
MTSTKKILLSGALALVFVLSGRIYYIVNCSGSGHLVLDTGVPVAHADAKKQKYTCVMHPSVIEDKPGNCPICGMKLTPVKPGAAGSNESQERGKPGNKTSGSANDEVRK